MAKQTDLTTLANFKAALNVYGTADDGWISQIISRTSAWIENITNRKLVARRYGEEFTDGKDVHPTTLVADEDYIYFDGNADLFTDPLARLGVFYLPVYPIQDNTVVPFELSILTSRDATGENWDKTSLVEFQDYLVDRKTGAVRMTGMSFKCGLNRYRVKCAAGYQGENAPWVPDDLEGLCIEMGALIYKDKKNLSSETVGTWSRTFNTDKDDPYISAILGAYTRFVIV